MDGDSIAVGAASAAGATAAPEEWSGGATDAVVMTEGSILGFVMDDHAKVEAGGGPIWWELAAAMVEMVLAMRVTRSNSSPRCSRVVVPVEQPIVVVLVVLLVHHRGQRCNPSASSASPHATRLLNKLATPPKIGWPSPHLTASNLLSLSKPRHPRNATHSPHISRLPSRPFPFHRPASLHTQSPLRSFSESPAGPGISQGTNLVKTPKG